MEVENQHNKNQNEVVIKRRDRMMVTVSLFVTAACVGVLLLWTTLFATIVCFVVVATTWMWSLVFVSGQFEAEHSGTDMKEKKLKNR